MKRIERKIEFSKIMFISIWFLTFGTVVASFIIIFMTEDLSQLSYLIPAIFEECAVGTGFYYNKAKLENKLKIMKDYKMEIGKEDLE